MSIQHQLYIIYIYLLCDSVWNIELLGWSSLSRPVIGGWRRASAVWLNRFITLVLFCLFFCFLDQDVSSFVVISNTVWWYSYIIRHNLVGNVHADTRLLALKHKSTTLIPLKILNGEKKVYTFCKNVWKNVGFMKQDAFWCKFQFCLFTVTLFPMYVMNLQFSCFFSSVVLVP